MRRAFAILLLAGCTNPDEIVPVRGDVTPPVEGQVVRLLRRFQEFGTSQCRSEEGVLFKETQTDSAGNFGFDLFRIEAESFGGLGSYCFRVESDFASGAAASTDFSYPRIGVRLPPFHDWLASPRLENGVLRFEPPIPLPPDTPPAPGELITTLEHTARLVTADGGTVWKASDRRLALDFTSTREPIVFDPVRLEDFSGTVILEAALSEPREVAYGFSSNGGPVRLRAAELLPLAGTRVPLSRGLPCAELGDPCPATDGELTSVDAGPIQDLSFELAAASPLSTVVLRGIVGPSRVIDLSLTQVDGGVVEVHEALPRISFESAPSLETVLLRDGGFRALQDSYLVIPVDAGAPVRSVKLHFPDGLWRVQEISLFE